MFKLYQWGIVFVICYSGLLGYKLISAIECEKRLESQRHHLVERLNKYRIRSDNQSFLARQYVISRKPDYLERYRMVSQQESDFELPQHSTDEQVNGESGFLLAEAVLLEKVAQVSDELRALERGAFSFSEAELGSGAQLQSEHYLALNLQLLMIIDRIAVSVNNRYRQLIVEADESRTLLIYSVPFALAFNLGLLIYSFFFIGRRMREHHEELEKLSLKDPLTDAHNRKFIMESGRHLLSINQREGTTMAVIMADIDHFKIINARFGYTAGDEVLKSFSGLIATRVRKTDLFARYGSEEFVILLNNVSAIDALEWANQLRKLVSRYTLESEQGPINFTLSVGVVMSDGEADLDHLVSLADKSLSRAKSGGRDQAVML
ncbi:MAG: GGDEF domain-containing protein [Pseudomonadales bacterium]